MQAQNRMGQILGNYRLMKLLGRGGYAEVYLAENVNLGIQTAIKLLKVRDLDILEREQFLLEAKTMATLLDHPHIIKIFDFGIEMSQRGSGNDGSTPYLVMEYAPLGTLRHLYGHGKSMPLAKIVSYTRQIADALQYGHDKNIIHRDIKPENMLVRKPDDAALSDFGIAVIGLNTGNLHLQQEEILRKMARGEQIMIPGTAAYLAPERILGHTQRASDQYSLAVVVYEWLCGSRPFEGNDLELCEKHTSEPPPPLSQRFPHIPKEVEQVVLKALSKKPGDRYKSVREFALALETAVQASLQLTTPKVTPIPPSVRSSTPPPAPSLIQPGSLNPVSPQSPPTIVSPPVSPPTIVSPPQPTPQTPPIPDYVHPSPTPGFSYTGRTVNIQPIETEDVAKPTTIIEELTGITSAVFVADRYFGYSRITRNFRLLGIPLNILSALIVLISGPLPASLIPAILGGVISVWMLWRCTISVKKLIALAFGAGVALWWTFVAASVAGHSNDLIVVALCSFIAFAISMSIHAWYVDNRLKN